MFRRFERSWMSRIFICAAAAVLIMVVFTPPAFSNSPSNVELTYDLGKQTLSVMVTHSPSSDSHYVKEIEIGKNGQVVGKYPYDSQPGDTFTYTYKITAQPGDVLEAKAICSKYGSKTGKMTVQKLD